MPDNDKSKAGPWWYDDEAQHSDEPYCHLCCCLRGWLHGYWSDHKPFLESDCQACWEALAR